MVQNIQCVGPVCLRDWKCLLAYSVRGVNDHGQKTPLRECHMETCIQEEVRAQRKVYSMQK